VRAPSPLIQEHRRFLETAALRGSFAIFLALLCANAAAQWSGSVAVVSDYRYRGVSLSDNDPAVQATFDYDDPSGFYAGTFLSNVRFAFASGRELQALPFIGYVWQLPSGVSGEVGVNYSVFSRTHDYDYPEIYAGFGSGNWSGRLYYTPRYFGRFGDAVYGELNYAQPLADRTRIVVHGGILRSKSYNVYGASSNETTFDARVGLAFDLDVFNLELNWVGLSNGQSAYPFASSGRRNGVVVTVMRPF
jgi:uncharacterized protein (TIGR02001 family)